MERNVKHIANFYLKTIQNMTNVTQFSIINHYFTRYIKNNKCLTLIFDNISQWIVTGYDKRSLES